MSQTDFDSAVQESMEALGLDEEEAIADTMEAFELQGADLTGIITSRGGAAASHNHPTVTAVTQLSEALEIAEKLRTERLKREERETGEVTEERGDFETEGEEERDSQERASQERASLEAIGKAIEVLRLEIVNGGEDVVAMIGKHSGVELTLKACERFAEKKEIVLMERGFVLANLLVTDDANKHAFLLSNGPHLVSTSLSSLPHLPSFVHVASSLAATAGTRFELIKEALMDEKVHVLFLSLMKRHVSHSGAVLGTLEGIKVLVTNDDFRVAASKTFINAQKIAEAGAVEIILEAAREYRADMKILSSICAGLTAVAVNEKVCKSVADLGGVDLALSFLTKATSEKQPLMAKTSCNLLKQLAGSDENKKEIVGGGGIICILETATTFSEDPNVIQESFASITALTLRHPLHASMAAEAGASGIISEAMERHPGAKGMQRQACQMVRNLAVRNPENRPLMLEVGIERLLRKAKADHKQCGDVSDFALQALGLEI